MYEFHWVSASAETIEPELENLLCKQGVPNDPGVTVAAFVLDKAWAEQIN